MGGRSSRLRGRMRRAFLTKLALFDLPSGLSLDESVRDSFRSGLSRRSIFAKVHLYSQGIVTLAKKEHRSVSSPLQRPVAAVEVHDHVSQRIGGVVVAFLHRVERFGAAGRIVVHAQRFDERLTALMNSQADRAVGPS